jgi:hypothetical protein
VSETRDPFEDVPFRSERSLAFARYWQSLPKQDLIPFRADFDPVDQGPVLSTYVIHELVSPEMIRIHLAGTVVSERYGREPTGKNYLDYIADWRRADAARSIFLTCEHPCGLLVEHNSRAQDGSRIYTESFGLPMRDEDGHARWVHYQANEIDPPDPFSTSRGRLAEIDADGEFYIDIGAGIPEFNQFELRQKEGRSRF